MRERYGLGSIEPLYVQVVSGVLYSCDDMVVLVLFV